MVFFDQKSIDIGRDWKRELAAGIRSSRLFIAFLSPHYIASENCMWEWEEYLRREHSSARGDDGILPIFFVTASDLTASEDQTIAAWLEDVKRRNWAKCCDLQPWFERGPEVLAELDAAERLAQVKAHPRAPADDLRTLAERLDELDRRIAARLDQIALADLAPGNVVRSHEHFVGRHTELSTLHSLMVGGGPQSGGHGTGGRGMIAAAHSPGGLGKTALARQYAHAYAGFYAAGGTWEVGCEGASSLGLALLRLVDDRNLQRAAQGVLEPLVLTEVERNDSDLAAVAILDYLRRLTLGRVEVVRRELKQHPDRHSPEADLPIMKRPRCLLILDNVDQPRLLHADQAALLPAEEWLEVIVTTRLSPTAFGAGERWARAVEIEPLPDADALDLLRDFQPGHQFRDPEQEQAARQIARALDGYTLAVELVAAYLGAHASEGYQPSDYLLRLQNEGLIGVDRLVQDPGVAKEVRHATDADRNRMATLIGWSLARLSAPARAALEFASLLQPDQIPLSWLEILTKQRYAEALTDQPGYPAKWPCVWRELYDLRLLHAADEIEVDNAGMRQLPPLVRIHRLVAEHVEVANADRAKTIEALDQFFTALGTMFEYQVGQGNDAWLRAQHPWLRDHLSHLIDRHVSPTLLRQAQVAADYEGRHNSLGAALRLSLRILAAQEQLLSANPDSAEAARDVSVSLNKLGVFLSSRGQPGDAEQALDHYEWSLKVREQLLSANPDSAQAARDVCVSQFKLFHFYRAQGDEELAVQHLAACFAIPDSFAQTGRPMDPQMRGLHAELKPHFS